MSTINIYDLNYTDAFKLGIRNYANFNGRASRSEYWRFVAGVTLIQGLLGILALLCSNLGFPNYEALIDNVTVGVSLFFIVPNIAITTRRMHDIGRSGWTQLISFIPVIGFFIFLVYELRRGDERENSYGERTGYTPITPEVSKATGLEETPSRHQDWAMGIAIFIIQSIIIADIIMIGYTFTQQYLVYLENTTHTSTLIIRKLIVVIYLVFFFIMLIFLDRNIRATIQSQLDFQKDIQLSHLTNYNKQIENLYQSVRSFRHDYANILTTLKLGIDQNDMAIVKEVYDSVLKDSDKHLKSKTFDLTRLINIEDNTIKSLLAAKFLEAEENNIDISLDIPETIKLEGMEMVDFITVISIFLDNAMEASIQSDIPKMHIGYFNHGNKQIFIVQNSTQEEFIPISSLFERGVSSKGDHRGIGLANVRNILDNYQNISLKTESMTFAFTQELNISKKA